MFRMSLDNLGGIYASASVVVVFGDSTISPLPERWRPHFERIVVHHADPDDYIARSYSAQADARWTVVPGDCDFAIMSDADTMVLRPFDDLLVRLVAEPGIAGTIAHFPFPQYPGELPTEKWASLAREWLGRELPLDYEHSLARAADPDFRRTCPFYLNQAFVVVPRPMVDVLSPTHRWLVPRVAPQLSDPFYRGQVALTLAVHTHDVTRHAIDIKYNFPNDRLAEELYPASMHDLRVIHYLRTDHFDRQQIFATAEAFERFLALHLTGSELQFQDHVRQLTGGQYPF